MEEKESENEKKPKDLKAELTGFIGSTTLHGIRYSCDDSPLARRVFWVVVVVCSVAFCAFQISMSLMTYYEFNTVTSTTTSSANDELRFPTLTLCNNNKVHRTRLNQLYPDIADLWRHAEYVLAGAEAPRNDTDMSLLANDTFRAVMFAAGLNSEETFVNCIFASETLNCSHFISDYHAGRGRCFSFHSTNVIAEQGLLSAKGPGPTFGAEFVLDAIPRQYYIPTDVGIGFSLFIHHSDVLPDIDSGGIKLGPGLAYDIAIKQHNYTILSTPYNEIECVGSDYPVAGNEGRPYSQELCERECDREFRKQVCHCVIKPRDDETEATECSLAHVLNCNNLDPPPCDCPPMCQSVEFDSRLSMSRYPNDMDSSKAVYLGFSDINEDLMRRRYVSVRVYFSSMRVSILKQSPAMQAWDIFSNVGGLFGLFMGASILTLLEFCDFVIVTTHHHFAKRLQRRNAVEKIQLENESDQSEAPEATRQGWM